MLYKICVCCSQNNHTIYITFSQTFNIINLYSWNKRKSGIVKNRIKPIVDFVMYIGLVLCMGYQLTGNLWHEYIGIFMFILFIIHLILNDHWFKHFGKIAKNSFSNIRSSLLFLTDLLLFFNIIALAITSVLISKNVFSFVSLQGSRFTSWLHTFSAYLGLIIMSLHIGCHWKGILLRVCNLFEMNKGTKGIKVVLRIIAGLLAVLGVVFSFQRDIGRRLLWDSSMKTMRPDMVKPDFSSANKNEFRNVQPNRDMQYGKGKENKQQISEAIQEGESQEDYLGRLICTGCGKQCSLLNPRCGIGQMQAQEAIAYYNQNVENSSIGAESISGTEGQNNTRQYGEEKKLRVSVDEDYLDLFTEYIAITGLYIAGTYYILEIIERRKSKKE